MTKDSWYRDPAQWCDLLAIAGAAVPLPLVLTRIDVVAFDADRSIRPFLALIAVALVIGIGVANAVAASRSRRIVALAAGALAIGFVDIGEPAWVTLGVLALIALSSATVLAHAVAIERAQSQRFVGSALSVGAAAVGVASALAYGTWSPVVDWGVVTAVGGVALIVAGALGWSQPDSIATSSAYDPRLVAREADGKPVAEAIKRPIGLMAFLAIGLWPLAAAQIQSDSVVGPRYPLLTLVGGALGALVIGGLGHLIDSRRSDTTSRLVQTLHATVAIGALAALAGITSHTLVGAATGWGISVACLGTAIVFASGIVSCDPEPIGRAVAVGRVIGRGLLGGALGLVASSIAEPRHHTWWLTIASLIVLHQSIRRLRRLTVVDLEPVAEPVVSAIGSTRSRDKALLDVRRLDSGYGALQVLFSVDFAVAPGEVVALLGPNGAGKTTLLRTIAGLHPTWSGRVQYGGVDLAGLDAAGRAGTGLMLISPEAAIARPLSVDDNLRLFTNTLSVTEMRAARERAFETFPKLKERLRQSAGTLSGGERQMLALSRAVMLRPRLLLIDELTLGLSPAAIADLGPAIRRLNDEGVAMVIVEQSTATALSLAQRAVCIERGAIVADFPAEELRAQPDLIRAIHLDGMSSVLSNKAAS